MQKLQTRLLAGGFILLLLAAAPITAEDNSANRIDVEDEPPMDIQQVAGELTEITYPLGAIDHDYAPLMEMIGDSRLVLIGEASHGTDEFYRTRADITRQLIEEEGFTAVAIEADWSSAYRVNQYVRGTSGDASAEDALSEFTGYPRWMWRNTAVLEFVEWLHDYNAALTPDAPQVGFYGLDLYAMFESADRVIAYLDAIDPDDAALARERYACFEGYGDDPQQYGLATFSDESRSCEDEARAQLEDIRANAETYIGGEDGPGEEAYLNAEKNALVVANGERYYRTMFAGGVSSWNLRDQHFFEVVKNLDNYLADQHGEAKLVIWAHNSHVGDARATDMSLRGELNLGQLVRQQYGDEAVLVGFSTYTGSVTASDDWGTEAEFKQVQPGLPESYETLFHEVEHPEFLVLLRGEESAAPLLDDPRLQRAIGVIYRPETERWSHYFTTSLPDQFDAMIHIDETQAVEPLEPPPGWLEEATLSTYPYGQ